ncbi:MAG TPA: DNRLRE domain-containing protein, partial [Planctomycetaceae bacterium]|nr:DNRLRE domain-containing protein [Planctomycetaceae bacterium]
GTIIACARLEMDVLDVAGAPAPWHTSLFNLDTAFSEGGTNWGNQPPPATFYGNTDLSGTGVHQWDATAMTQDWLSGAKPNRGVVLAPRPSGSAFDLYYYSRESTGGTGPRLIVECGEGPPTATPTRTPTPYRRMSTRSERRDCFGMQRQP